MSKKEKMYLIDGDTECYPIDEILDKMADEDLEELTVELAEKEKHPDEFWCICDSEAYPLGGGICGNECINYEPRNGKSGICRNHGYTYIGTKQYTLNINGELKEIKEKTNKKM